MEPYADFGIPQPNSPLIHSRVIYDNFHCYNQFPISHHHGLRRPFARALSSAFFIPVAEDKAAVERVLRNFGVTYNSQLLSKPAWMFSRVRRFIPPPEILLPRVAEVIKTYGPLKDATTKQPLFNDRAWDVAKHVMENVRLGYYSDPLDINLYFTIGKDRHGLTLYRCCRGTNSVEGGVHQNLIRHYTSFNTSPRHAINVLLDYTVTHNMTVGTMNRTGRAYAGHFHVPLKNRISRLLDLTMDALVANSSGKRSGWVNGNDYEPAHETFGMIQFLPTFFKPLGMLEFDAVFALHTREERDLFQLLVASSPLFTDPTRQPKWVALAVAWSGHADGRTIFYKLPEHLKAYYKTWTDFCNEQNTVALNAEACQCIRALVRSIPPNVPINAPTALPTTLRDSLSVSSSVDITEVNSWQIGKLLADHALQRSAVHYLYADTVQAQSSVTGPSRAAKRKATAGDAAVGVVSSGSTVRTRSNKPRKCRNCQSSECPGRWSVSKCPIPLAPGIRVGT